MLNRIEWAGMWYSGIGWTVPRILCVADSPTYPTWYSGIGRTVGFGGPEWDSGFPWTVPPILHGTVG